MLLITHHTGEGYGLLGPQIVANYLSTRLGLKTVVLGIKRDFNEKNFFEFVEEHYSKEEKIVLFSYHCGRPDILRLAQILKSMGYKTVLGGPQTEKDMSGEPNVEMYPERINGFSQIFDLGYSGPIDEIDENALRKEIGLIKGSWGRDINVDVNWDNIFVFGERVERLKIEEAQVLRSIGCPYASRKRDIIIDPPAFIPDVEPVKIETGGCSFCDVAWDKGFSGNLSEEKVLEQLDRLPELDGKKIPFELIDEYPISFLPTLLSLISICRIRLSQINLVLRVDDILKRYEILKNSLKEMTKKGLKLFLSSIGFESFSEKILRNLNKGVTVSQNLEAIRIIRELKREFPETLFYSREEGAIHGFIHPTPWDDMSTEVEIRSAIGAFDLFRDILPYHSTPLIIHHGSALGDWVRTIEESYGIRFSRRINIIEWWDYKRL